MENGETWHTPFSYGGISMWWDGVVYSFCSLQEAHRFADDKRKESTKH